LADEPANRRDAALPWLAGAVAQNAGMWVLPPFAIVLAWPSSPSGGQSPDLTG
jgi:hypothetical protein